jgi:hypothetical protein
MRSSRRRPGNRGALAAFLPSGGGGMRSKTVSVVFLLAICGLAFAQAKKPLANSDVIQMMKAGFEESIIVKAIQANETNFDISGPALVDLKAAGATPGIIDAMLTAEAKKKPPSGVASPEKPVEGVAAEVPGNAMSSGVYCKTASGWVELESLPMSSMKTAPNWGRTMAGINSNKLIYLYNGAEAPVKISETRPTFYLRYYRGYTSARNFSIVRMDQKKDHRELQTTHATFSGTSVGYNEKDIVAVDFTIVSDGLYAITPKADLVKGEYVFTIAGTLLWDFGITGDKK